MELAADCCGFGELIRLTRNRNEGKQQRHRQCGRQWKRARASIFGERGTTKRDRQASSRR